MTPDERELMAILFERIASEKDLKKYEKWVREINELFARKRERLTQHERLQLRRSSIPGAEVQLP